jgi:hypothetical protein
MRTFVKKVEAASPAAQEPHRGTAAAGPEMQRAAKGVPITIRWRASSRLSARIKSLVAG